MCEVMYFHVPSCEYRSPGDLGFNACDLEFAKSMEVS